jgi:gamma-glutamyl-gamma-aminobutyrate hydrolase PuuD
MSRFDQLYEPNDPGCPQLRLTIPVICRAQVANVALGGTLPKISWISGLISCHQFYRTTPHSPLRIQSRSNHRAAWRQSCGPVDVNSFHHQESEIWRRRCARLMPQMA